MNDTVQYRDIPGVPGYRVGSDGSVWTCRLMGAHSSRRGTGEWRRCRSYRRPYGCRYVVVCFRVVPGGPISCHYIHQLVLEAFVGACPEGMEARHFPDRDTSNNRLENLRWATHQQNIDDKKFHGTARPRRAASL